MIQSECDRRKQNRQPVHRGRMNVKQDNMEKAFSVVEGGEQCYWCLYSIKYWCIGTNEKWLMNEKSKIEKDK